MKDFAIANIPLGRLNALVKNLMRQMGIDDPAEVIRRINSGEWGVNLAVRRWREENGIIYFSVTSDGTSGEEWIARLESKGVCVDDWAKSILRSQDFQPTTGITVEIAVLKSELFKNPARTTKNIFAFAEERMFRLPNAEAACLIRESFSGKEIKAMGLGWIGIMHEPIKDSAGDLARLGVDFVDDRNVLASFYDGQGDSWAPGACFAFVVSAYAEGSTRITSI